MKRFLWISLIFGGGVASLMVAAIILHQQAEKVVAGAREDLKTPVEAVRRVLADWQGYDKLAPYTSDVTTRTYNELFDDANGSNPGRQERFKGTLSAMETFPSVRFANLHPERVEVHYEVTDGASAVKPSTAFVSTRNGFFMPLLRFPVNTNVPTGTSIGFQEGETLELNETLETLLDTLTRGNHKELRALMMMGPEPDDRQVADRLGRLRAQVMNCGTERLKKMLPELGPLPRGTRWFRLIVVGEVDRKRLWLNMEVVPGEVIRIRRFGAGIARQAPRIKKPPQKKPAS